MQKPLSVEDYIVQNSQWSAELELLRELLLETTMEETIKWAFPVYTHQKKNVIGLSAMKSYVGLWFHQGVFLSDPAQKLYNANEGVTKALRQWRFNNLQEIQENIDLIRAYIQEAISNQEQGLVMKAQKNTKPIILPEELKELFLKKPNLKDYFDPLSLAKRRDFADYISSAKRQSTKEKRLAEIEDLLLSGKTPMDKYRKK